MAAGIGYGLFVLDDASRDYLLKHLEDHFRSPHARQPRGSTLWENMLERA